MTSPDLSQLDLSHLAPQDRVVVSEFLRRKTLRKKGESFLSFSKHVYPELVIEEIHVLIARHFEMLRTGEIDRLMIMMPPRAGKSLFTSELLPAWWEGHFPKDKILHASYASTLVEKFGRKIRNTLQSPEYHEIFPDTVLSKDSKSAAQWATTLGGEYNAVGVGGGVAGKGGNLLCISPDTRLQTKERGWVAAGSVLVGEHLPSWHGWTRVLVTMDSEHENTVTLAGGLQMTSEHSVWTYTRGWVESGKLKSSDILWSMTLYDTITSHLHGGLYGRASRGSVFFGSQRQCCGVLAGELPVGRRRDAAEQPYQCCEDNGLRKNVVGTSVGEEVRYDRRSGNAQNSQDGDGSRGGVTSPENESYKTDYLPVPNTGWRAAGISLVGRCCQKFTPGKVLPHKRCSLGGLAKEKVLQICGLVLGVRPVGDIRHEQHEHKRFVNFTVDGDNTFVDNTILVHNCIDDPNSEQDAFSRTAHDNTYAWFGGGYYTRRQPDRNCLVITMTRWMVADLAGRLLADGVTNPGADQWTVLKIPAIVDEEAADMLNDCSDDPHIETPHFYRPGDSFSPRRWSLEELQRTKNTITRKAWASLYLQSPTEEEGGILLREWWKPWHEGRALPEIEYTLQSYDTAFEEGETNDFSARTTWGVFKRVSDGKMCVLVLEAMKRRMDFPKLLEDALDSYEAYKPDRVIIEKAASGAPLIQEMRKRGVPVTPVKPVGSKIARANAATILFEQGCVYYPENRKWALDVIDDCAEFPNGPHDDIVDTVSQALVFLRRMFMLETPDDEDDEDDPDEYDPSQAQTSRSYARRQSRLPTHA